MSEARPTYLANLWATFEAGLPGNASDGARRAMKIAFFAGAEACFSTLITKMDGEQPDDAEPTAAELDLLDDIENELVEHRAQIVAAAAVRGTS